MKNSLTTSDIRDLTNEGIEFGVDNRAVKELLNEAQEREEFEAWLDSRMDDARAHMDAKWRRRWAWLLDALTEGWAKNTKKFLLWI